MTDPRSTSVFLSHSSRDAGYAATVVKLLRRTIKFDDDEIMCTSVPGHTLPPGASYERDIRKAIRRADYFIVLLSASSVTSFFCAIECGVAWSKSKKPLAAVCLPGFTPDEIPRPLQSLQVLKWGNVDDWFRLLRNVAERTASRRLDVDRWEHHVNEAIHAAAESNVDAAHGEKIDG